MTLPSKSFQVDKRKVQFWTHKEVLSGKRELRAKGDLGAVTDDDSICRISANFYLL